ncbi:MAG: chromate transporter [Hespellia sp.]|nr:chromate transporter [Hespellia sp.]
MKKLWELYASFFRIGILTIGGGLAMLPMLKREVVDKYHWINEEEMMDIYAIGQCTPGIIAVNTATYIGYLQSGIVGGIVATLGEVTPSLVIIILIASVLRQYMENAVLLHAFAGIRIAVCAMMFDTVLLMIKKGIKNFTGVCLFFGALIFATFTPVPLPVIVLLAGAVGVIAFKLHRDEKGGAA